MGADHSRWPSSQTQTREENIYGDTPTFPDLQITRNSFRLPVDLQESNDDDLEEANEEKTDFSVSFEYICKRIDGSSPGISENGSDSTEADTHREDSSAWLLPNDSQPNLLSANRWKKSRSSSFTSLSGAALSANATLANTTVCNNTIGGIVLPGLDSPRYFRRLMTFPSSLSSTSSEASSKLSSSTSPSKPGYFYQNGGFTSVKTPLSNSAPNDSSSFLYAQEIRTAGGAAGEDRVQAVCSEENGWVFCGIYDGFNGRDAADYLAANLYEKIGTQLRFLEFQTHDPFALTEKNPLNNEATISLKKENDAFLSSSSSPESSYSPSESDSRSMVIEYSLSKKSRPGKIQDRNCLLPDHEISFRRSIIDRLTNSLRETEADFFEMVEQEMDDRPEIAMVGSCVLATLIHDQDIYTLNLGDSRAILATQISDSDSLHANPLTEIHTLENASEKKRVFDEHPDDPMAVVGTRVKGKLRVTRAFGAGYLKSTLYNDGLMGILRVRNLRSPPYISSTSFVRAHRIQPRDRFVVLASDGLFDFFSDQEVVDCVWSFVSRNPCGDPASHMLDLLIQRAAANACMSVEDLKNVPIGRRRNYHDDVTVVIVTLGDSPKTNSASLS